MPPIDFTNLDASGFQDSINKQVERSFTNPQETAQEARIASIPGYANLYAQLGAMQAIGLQNNVNIYQNRSPVDANTHIINIATSLAKDYGVTDLRDIGITQGVIPKFAIATIQQRGKPTYSAQTYDVGSDGILRWNDKVPITLQQYHVPGEPVQQNLLYNTYYNKNNPSIEIPAYKFASSGEGDGYSDYTLQSIKLADGTSIVLPMQEYSKSGFGEVQENLAPYLPIVALALAATGVGTAIGTSILGAGASVGAATAVGSAALNLGAQALAGKIENVSDVLQAVAPSAVTFGLSEIADVYKAVDTAKQALAYDALINADKLEDLGTVSSSIKAATDAGTVLEQLTGISGKAADVLGNAIKGGVSASLSDQDITTGTVFGALEGFKTPKTDLREPASVTEANPFKSSFEITPTTLTSAPENTDALSKALGIETFSVDNPLSGITNINKQTEEALAGAGTTTVSSINDQTNELFEPFSKEAFMPGKTTTTPTFTSTTQEGMLGDVGSGVSNLTGSTIIGDVTDVNQTNTYGGMLGEVGSGASNLTNNKSIGDVTTLDVTGVNKGLGGTLGLSNYTGDTLYDPRISMQGQGDKVTSGFAGGADQAKTLSGSDIVKIGTAVVGLGAAGSALDSTNKTITTPTPSLKPTYANAPIKGFRMQKMQNEGGLTTYIPYINQTSLLPVPTGYKSI